MGTPLAGAAALRPGRAWALLHRSPEFLDDPPEGVHFIVRVQPPPCLSTLVVSRARALLAAGGDAEDLVGHVKCADAEGDILLTVWSADEQGRPASPPRLLVCRPDSSTVDLVPPVPDQLGRLEWLAPLGILRAAAPPGFRGGVHYLIAQLQRAGSSPSSSSPAVAHQRAGSSFPAAAPWLANSSSPSSSAAAAAHMTHHIAMAGRADSSSPSAAHLRALVFSSSSGTWSTKEVRPRRFHASSSEDEASWSMVKEDEDARPLLFEAHDVLSHDSAGLISFVDVDNGLLLFFDPEDADMARFVSFPVSDSHEDFELGLEEEEVEALAAFSQGKVCLLKVSRQGRVTMWLLSEEEDDRWAKVFQVAGDEIYLSNSCVAKCKGPVEIGAVDPTDRCKLVFFMPDAQMAFMVVVNPAEYYSRSVGFLKQAMGAGRNSWYDVLIWRFDPAWIVVTQGAPGRSVSTTRGNRKWTGLGGMARRAIRIARKHIHRVQPLADFVGTTAEVLGVPLASKVSPAVAGLVKANKAACVGEEVLEWWNKPSPKDEIVVGTPHEAEQVIEYWIAKEKPKDMVVIPAAELSDKELLDLGNLFRRDGAQELLSLPDNEYDMVGTAARYFPR